MDIELVWRQHVGWPLVVRFETMGEARMVPADIAFLEDLGGACCSADRNRFGDFLLEGKTTEFPSRRDHE